MLRVGNVTTRTACWFLPILLVLVQPARSPAVDEIVARYLKEMGGLERLRAWKAMKATGRYVLVAEGGTEAPFTVWYKAPDKTRVEIGLGGQAAIYAFDGGTAWFCDPAAGHPDSAPMPDEQAAEIKKNADQYPLVDYKAKGHRLDLLGADEFEGSQVHKLKLTRANGSESIHFLDARSGRELKILTSSRRNGSDVTYETIERDFRRVDWLLLPFEVETRVNGKVLRRMLLQAADILPDLDDSIFRMRRVQERREAL